MSCSVPIPIGPWPTQIRQEICQIIYLISKQRAYLMSHDLNVTIQFNGAICMRVIEYNEKYEGAGNLSNLIKSTGFD